MKVLATGLDFPSDIAVDATHAYVLASDALVRVSLDGDGGPAEAFFGSRSPLAGLAMDAESVFSFRKADGALLAIPKTGGPARPIAKLPAAYSIAADASDLYVTSGAIGGTITRVPKAGGDPVTMVADLDFPSDVAMVGEAMWFVEYGRKRIGRVAKTGGAVSWIATSPTIIHAFAPFVGGIAWVDTGVRALRDGDREPREVWYLGSQTVTVRDGFAYWAMELERASGVFRRPLAGGERVKLADCPERVEAMTTDERFLYLAERGAKLGTLLEPRSARVLRVPLPAGP
ncbi:MAG: hypothetical protein HY901_23200 [Deltaproteobacteria bacterium]|nr:hypothetical protein [Deltaproteobacteria bacterium]